ncbi:MAG: hypothetical protein HQ581_05495 [Planctomycetes bacterium]|nr:hypothetical protein [Planctomycetota bacterium]
MKHNRLSRRDSLWLVVDSLGMTVRADGPAYRRFSRKLDDQLAQLLARWPSKAVFDLQPTLTRRGSPNPAEKP